MTLSNYFDPVEVDCLSGNMYMDFYNPKEDSFDSDDERFMYMWLMAAKNSGLVKDFFRPKQIVLLPSIGAYTSRPRKVGVGFVYKHIKINNRPTRYSPDFVIIFNKAYVIANIQYFTILELDPINQSPLKIEHQGEKTFFTVFYTDYDDSYTTMIDIKPEVKFSKFGASHRDFPIKQNILFHIHTILVTEFVLLKSKIPELFREIGTPTRYLGQNKRPNMPRKLHYKPNKLI
jgi:hypothetical protein